MTVESIYKTSAGERQVAEIYDSILSRWPGDYQTQIVPTRHGNTFVISSGDPTAPPLVLLHGACSNALAWIGDAPVYSPHFRVYAIDTIGEPGRSAHNRPAWNSPGYAEWLEDVLDGLGIQRAALLGISQGGWTALKFATTCPERVEKLVLLAPGGVMPPRASFIAKALFLSLFGRWGAEQINRITFGDQTIHVEAQQYMNVIMTHFKARKEPQTLYCDAELARLIMPVLLVIGSNDALFPTDAIAVRLSKHLPNLTIDRLPDTGHVLANLAGRILPFLLK